MTLSVAQGKIYTIGYAAFPHIEIFMDVLSQIGVNVLIDVRSIPFSRNYSDYNQRNVEQQCRKYKIYYRHYKDEFGARQMDTEYYTDGIVDFERFAGSEAFRSGKSRMLKAIDSGYTPCLLCAEKDPIICHRSILIGRELMKDGVSVVHIHGDGTMETQEQLQARLVDTLFPKRAQIQMWDEPMSESDYIEEAYRIQNRRIGFRIDT